MRTSEETRAKAREAALAKIARSREVAREKQYLGVWTLFYKEILRFWTIAGQTVISPVITTMLYFLVFGYSLGDRLQEIQGVPYMDFLVPGLVMLALITNAYINSAFSLFITKVHGTIVDLLVTPLTYVQFLSAYVAAAVVRAMLIGTIIWLVAWLMGASPFYSVPIALAFMMLTSTAFAFGGVVVAILAEDFDHINLFPSFLITPLTFLGGVFYSIGMLPDFWRSVSLFNPVLYMVNGVRYGMVGVSDVPLWQGALLLVGLNVLFGALALWLLKTGKKLRD
ncbi:ABC transporter [Lujinxingia litoralis]|uniref:Transport permease protein n=1 Tax=Lujinxingia litoralis TaxID=2211119 RepID=A0A328C856_9DELT|nr:ABC transporter permease [Lujinxingia litoralis]RAL22784.1 ABC transporter [Lujinxingia litoralis]